MSIPGCRIDVASCQNFPTGQEPTNIDSDKLVTLRRLYYAWIGGKELRPSASLVRTFSQEQPMKELTVLGRINMRRLAYLNVVPLVMVFGVGVLRPAAATAAPLPAAFTLGKCV